MTPIEFQCKACQTKLRISKPELAGKKIRCPKCKTVVQVPGDPTPKVSAAPPVLKPAAEPKPTPQQVTPVSPPPQQVQTYEPPLDASNFEDEDDEFVPPRKSRRQSKKSKRSKKRKKGGVPIAGIFACFVALSYLGAAGAVKMGMIEWTPRFGTLKVKFGNNNFNKNNQQPGGRDPNIVGDLKSLGLTKNDNPIDLPAIQKKFAEEQKLIEQLRDPNAPTSHDPIVSLPKAGQFGASFVAFSADLEHVFLVNFRELKAWSLKDKAETGSLRMEGTSYSMDMASNRKLLASHAKGTLQVISLPDCKEKFKDDLGKNISKVTFFPTGNRLMVSGSELKSSADINKYGTTAYDTDSKTFLDFGIKSTTGKLLFSPINTELVCFSTFPPSFWNLETGALQKPFSQFLVLTRPVFAPDGKSFAAGSHVDKKPPELVIFDKNTGSTIANKESGFRVDDLAYSPDGKYLVACLEHDKELSKRFLKIFEMPGVKEVRSMPLPSSGRVDFSPGGALLVVASQGTHVYDFAALLKNKKENANLKPVDPPAKLTEAEAVAKVKQWGDLERNQDGTKFANIYKPDADLRVLQFIPKLTSVRLTDDVGDKGVPLLKGLKGLKRLELNDFILHKFTDSALTILKEFPDLEVLVINNCDKMTNEGLVHLKHCPNLTRLEISNNKEINGSGMVHLAPLTKLTELDLKYSSVDGESMKYLLGMKELKALDLERTKVDDSGLTHIKELTGLIKLQLGYVNITDAGLAHLANLNQLEELGIYGNPGVKGPGLVHLKNMPKVTELYLGGTGVDNDGLKGIAELTHLKRLNLPDNITDEGFKHLAGLTNLNDLPLYNLKKLQGPGLAYLKDMPKIEGIYSLGPAVTDDGLKGIEPLTQLTGLSLPKQITDKALVHVKPLINLTYLNMQETQVEGTGLPELKDLPKLEFLDLNKSKIKDEALAHLKDFKALKTLVLNDTKISDAGLKHIGEIPTLTRLELRSTQVTNEALEAYKKAHPNVKDSK